MSTGIQPKPFHEMITEELKSLDCSATVDGQLNTRLWLILKTVIPAGHKELITELRKFFSCLLPLSTEELIWKTIEHVEAQLTLAESVSAEIKKEKQLRSIMLERLKAVSEYSTLAESHLSDEYQIECRRKLVEPLREIYCFFTDKGRWS